MNIADRVRAIAADLLQPFVLQQITSQMPDVFWRDVNATLHRLCNRGELTKEKIINPKGHGDYCKFTRTDKLRAPGQQQPGVRGAAEGPKDIGNAEAAQRLQHAFHQMIWAQQKRNNPAHSMRKG